MPELTVETKDITSYYPSSELFLKHHPRYSELYKFHEKVIFNFDEVVELSRKVAKALDFDFRILASICFCESGGANGSKNGCVVNAYNYSRLTGVKGALGICQTTFDKNGYLGQMVDLEKSPKIQYKNFSDIFVDDFRTVPVYSMITCVGYLRTLENHKARGNKDKLYFMATSYNSGPYGKDVERRKKYYDRFSSFYKLVK